MTDILAPPEGFRPFAHPSPFLERAAGDIWERSDEGRLVVGLRVAPDHANSWGAAHGGLLSTLADVALGAAIARPGGLPLPILVGLDMDLVDSAPIGSWVEVRTEVLRVGRRLGFCGGDLTADGQRVARASGIYAMRPAPTP